MKKYSTRDYLPKPRTMYFRIFMIKTEMISISEGIGMSDFRDQEIQEVFTQCDPDNKCMAIIFHFSCLEKYRFPRPADSRVLSMRSMNLYSSRRWPCHSSYL